MELNLILNLKEILPEASWPLVISALRQDQVVWNRLLNDDFSKKSLAVLKGDPKQWTPINLSLLDISSSIATEESSVALGISEELKILANETLEGFSKEKNINTTVSLQMAGLLALALFEKWKITGNWDFVTLDTDFAPISVWKPVFAGLFGLVEAPESLLDVLLSTNSNSKFIELGLHGLLSNQFSNEEIVELISNQLILLGLNSQLEILQIIDQKNSNLTRDIASIIINDEDNQEIGKTNNVENLFALAEIYQYSGQISKAFPLLDLAWEQTRNNQINLSAKFANLAVINNDSLNAKIAIERAVKMNPKFETAQADFAIAQFQSGKLDPKHFTDETVIVGENQKYNPVHLLVQAKLALKSGDDVRAKTLATKSLDYILQSKNKNEKEVNKNYYLNALINLLFSLKLFEETIIAGNEFISINPNDPEILSLISQAQLALGNLDQAIETSHLTISLDPKSDNNHRVLGKSLIAKESWKEALSEFKALVNKTPHYVEEDQYSMALSALKANEDKFAIETSHKIIENNSSNGSAHALLGEAFIKKGEIEKALDHLNQAIAYSPEIPEPWLALSGYELEKGDLAKATEKLISANQAIPENAFLRFELGKRYLENNNMTKALTEIQHAASLVSNENPRLSQEVNISLGTTLMDLGYFEEAKKRLATAHAKYPDNLNISHNYAKSLIGVEEIPQAIDILSSAIESPKADKHIFRDYGEAHLKLGENPKEAIKAFEKVLAFDPEDPRSIALMAEAIALDGDLKKSLETFKTALSKGLSNDSEWNLRIKIGMAKAALASNKPNEAVVALEDLIKANPADLRILQILTDAYLASKLNKSALKTVETIQQLENNFPATLLWIAEKALVLDKAEIATQALISAMKISPDSSDILVRLGYMHLQNEEISLAKAVFEKVLNVTNPLTKDLRLIAKALIGHDDILESVPYLERAIKIGDDNQTELISELMAVFLQLNDHEKALDMIEQLINLSPTEARLLQTKADILLDLDRPMAALSSILEAIKIDPKDSELQLKASNLFRINKDLPAALHHTEKALENDPENIAIQMQYAEINFVTLNFSQLDNFLIDTDDNSQSDEWRMLKADRLNHVGDYPKAKEQIEKIGFSTHLDPRYLAIQAQLSFQAGDPIEAKSALRKAIKNIDTIDNINLTDEDLNRYYFAIIQAALILSEWETALKFSSAAIESSPNEPLPHWLRMKAFILRAEFQHLCLSANAIKHASGPNSLNEQAIKEFEECTASALRNSCTDEGKNEVLRWQTRGRLAFSHLDADLEFLTDSAEDISVQMAAFRRQGKTEQAIQLAQNQNEDPKILLQLALTIADEGLIEAQGAAYKATEKQAHFPINHAILAYLAEKNEEYALASESIRRALNIWGDEAEWHILAGKLQSALGFRTATIAHFEKANQLRPNYAPYILELGKAHLSDQRSENAIKIFEKAVQLNHENPEIWSCLASAYQDSHNYEQATFCVDKLTELIPDQVEPYLVGAKISLSAGNLENVDKMIAKALSIEPDLTSASQLQAQALSLGNQTEKAITVLDKAIAKSSDPLPLLIDRAKLMPLIHGEEVGLSTLKSISVEYPKEPTILMALTEALIQAGKYEEAIETAQNALKENFGKLEQKDIAHLQFQLGILLKQSGQYDLAIHYLNETIQQSPGFLNAYLEIAEVYRNRRQQQEALDYLKQAISIAPNDPRPFSIAGNLLKDAKDYQGAKDMLDRAANLAPKDIEIQRKLGAVIALTLVHPTQNRED